MQYIQDQDFVSKNYNTDGFPQGEYENCSFRNCNFSRVNLSGINFSECEFEDCDLSNAEIRDTGFKDVKFKNCKLMGLAFNNCNEFLLYFYFERCLLNFSSFFGLKIPRTHFVNCQLQQVDFSEAILTESSFSNCELSQSVFQNSHLENCDFRGSINYSLDPENNRIAEAKFSMPEVLGLLSKYKIKVY